MQRQSESQKADDAILVLQVKGDFAPRTDRELRLAIKTLRQMILSRQQRRAASKRK